MEDNLMHEMIVILDFGGQYNQLIALLADQIAFILKTLQVLVRKFLN